MTVKRPDFENWTDEDFETRADEVCAYAHSIDWLGKLGGLRHETYLDIVVRCEAAIEAPTEVSRQQIAEAVDWARDEGTSWERIGELLGTSAAEAEARYGGVAALSTDEIAG